MYDFGPFRFLPDEKLLLRDGRPVPLPPKAIDTLAVLVERHGHVVLKDDLMRRVWPGTFVEEGNLTQQISLLRKVLVDVGDESIVIETIPRRGYRLMAAVTASAGEDLLVMQERTHTEVLVEELAAAAGTRVSTGMRTWRPIAGAIVLAAFGGAVAYSWLTGSRPALPFEKRDWVLILDFENTTGDPRFDRALATAFSVGLEQSQYFNVYSRTRTAGALQRMGKPSDTPLTDQIGSEVARRDGVRALVATSVARVGSRFALMARLIDPRRGLTVAAYTARAEDEDRLLEALDQLARSVRQGLGESRTSISQASKPLPQVTTSSFTALQAYVEGSRAWNSGRLREGIAAWEQAVALDPDFALAHAQLGSAFETNVTLDSVKARTHFAKALSLTDRTTERERLLIESYRLSALGHQEELIRVYDLYLKSYPDDPAAHLNRGLSLMRQQRCDAAIAGFQQVLRINPSSAAAIINIATCHNTKGEDRQAVSFYERAFALEPSWLTVANLNHEYGFALVGAGEIARARETFRRALLVPDTTATGLRSLALVDMYQGKYRDAEAKLRESQRSSSQQALRRARNHLFLAVVRAGQRRRAEQRQELDRAAAALAELPPSPLFALRTAAAYARAGVPEKAAKLVQFAGTHTDDKNLEVLAELHRARGELALARGNQVEGFEALTVANRTNPSALTLESLAYAHRTAGETADAVAAYEMLLKSVDWYGWEAQQSWIEAHVHLAELHAAAGETSKAAALLDAFLTRWKDADPDLPLIAEARRLSRSLRSGKN